MARYSTSTPARYQPVYLIPVLGIKAETQKAHLLTIECYIGETDKKLPKDVWIPKSMIVGWFDGDTLDGDVAIKRWMIVQNNLRLVNFEERDFDTKLGELV